MAVVAARGVLVDLGVLATMLLVSIGLWETTAMVLSAPSNLGADTFDPALEPALYRSAMVETSLTGGSSSASARRLAAVLRRGKRAGVRALSDRHRHHHDERLADDDQEEAFGGASVVHQLEVGFVEDQTAGRHVTAQRRRGLHRGAGAEEGVIGVAVEDPLADDTDAAKGAFHAQSSSQAGARSKRNSLTTPHFSSSSDRFSVPMKTSLSDTSTRATIVRLRSAGSVTEA